MDYFKKIIDLIQKNRMLRHLLFWLVNLLVHIPAGLLDGDTLTSNIIMGLCLLIPQILASYFVAYYLIPKFILKKKYLLSVILFILTSYLISVLGRVLTVHVGEDLVRAGPFVKEPIQEIIENIPKLYFHYFPIIYSVVFLFLFLKYFLKFWKLRDKEVLLSKEKFETELKVLKAQLNPHFLFNTLNNIYALSLDASPKAPLAIAKLSEILDYVLYKCNGQFVDLINEITLIKNYIELQKLRYDQRLEIKFDTDIENTITIPPLILLSLVENAFKHGAGEDSGSPKIEIKIFQKENHFKFEILNSVSATYESKNEPSIGLTNIRKQLDLIYNQDYKLSTYCDSGFFKVSLDIQLVYNHEN